MNKAKALLLSSRPWSFPMTIGSVMVGSLLAARTGGLDPFHTLLVVVGAVFLHAATNLTNDYFDFQEEVDKRGSPTTRYRDQPLVEGRFDPSEFKVYVLVMYLIGAAIGGYLTYVAGPMIVAFGLLGIGASYFYTGGVSYKYLGWGELAVFLVWGPLIVTGAYYVQAERLALAPVLVSIPLGLLVALTLLANNIRDRDYDREAGVTTVANLLDKTDAIVIYMLLVVGTYSTLGYLVLDGILSVWGILGFLSFPLAYKLLRTFVQEVPDDADARTAKLDSLFSGLMTVSLIFELVL